MQSCRKVIEKAEYISTMINSVEQTIGRDGIKAQIISICLFYDGFYNILVKNIC